MAGGFELLFAGRRTHTSSDRRYRDPQRTIPMIFTTKDSRKSRCDGYS
jgi:hypothetical protein